jgi:hypothetical protein
MADWFKGRLESILDNLVLAGIIAMGVALWALIRTLPGPIIFTIALATFALVMFVLRMILSLQDRQEKKREHVSPKRDPSVSANQLLATPASQGYIGGSYIAGRTINLMDLLRPGAPPIIENRTIEDCEIRGPAIVGFLEGNSLDTVGFLGDADSVLVELPEPRHIIGAIGVRGCVFRRCHFVEIGIIGVRGPLMEQIKKEFKTHK